MAVLRSRLAYIIVAVLRSTPLRRVVEHPAHPRRPRGVSSSLHPGVNIVRPRPNGLRALRVDPRTPSPAYRQTSAEPPVRRAHHQPHEPVATALTNRSTSTPARRRVGRPRAELPGRAVTDARASSRAHVRDALPRQDTILIRRYALPELCVSTDRPHSDAIFGRAGAALPGRLARLVLSSTAK
jgi:hypothetical protein